MDDRVARYLIAVAEAGSLRAAAERVGVTQPALTKALRRLEDEIRATLLERTVRGVRLTVFGEAVLRHAQAIRASVREAHEEVAALKDGHGGRVRIGAGPSWQRSILPAAIKAFRADWPKVRLEIAGGMDDALKARLRAGELDIVLAAMATAPAEPDLEGRPLIDDVYGVVARGSHPLALVPGPIPLAALLDHPWTLAGRGSMLVTRLTAIYHAHGLPAPDAIVETDIATVRLTLMRDCDYLSFLALGQLAELGPGTIVPLDVPDARWRRQAGIMMRRGVSPNPAAEAMIGTIERTCAAFAPASEGGG